MQCAFCEWDWWDSTARVPSEAPEAMHVERKLATQKLYASLHATDLPNAPAKSLACVDSRARARVQDMKVQAPTILNSTKPPLQGAVGQ